MVQIVIQLISWLFRPMSCAPRLVQCCRSFLRTLPLVALLLTCLVNLPTFTHRFCSPIRTFFRRSASSPMFSLSCPRFPYHLPLWFRMFGLVVFGGLFFHIVLHLVYVLCVRARWVFCIQPPRVAIKIPGLYLGIYGRFVSTLCKEVF